MTSQTRVSYWSPAHVKRDPALIYFILFYFFIFYIFTFFILDNRVRLITYFLSMFLSKSRFENEILNFIPKK